MSTDAYRTNKGLRVDLTDQVLIKMQIDITLSGNCSNVAGWTVRPVVDVDYVHAFGDTDLDATSHVGDVAMGTSLDVWSENVGRFTIGAKARNVNIGFGFNSVEPRAMVVAKSSMVSYTPIMSSKSKFLAQ